MSHKSQRHNLSSFQPRSFSIPILVTVLPAPSPVPVLPKTQSLETSVLCSHHIPLLHPPGGSWAREGGGASHRKMGKPVTREKDLE